MIQDESGLKRTVREEGGVSFHYTIFQPFPHPNLHRSDQDQSDQFFCRLFERIMDGNRTRSELFSRLDQDQITARSGGYPLNPLSLLQCVSFWI
jgi:hypothetical protein